MTIKKLFIYTLVLVTSSCSFEKIDQEKIPKSKKEKGSKSLIDNQSYTADSSFNNFNLHSVFDSCVFDKLVVDSSLNVINPFEDLSGNDNFFQELPSPERIINYNFFKTDYPVHEGLYYELWVFNFQSTNKASLFSNLLEKYCEEGKAEGAMMIKRFDGFNQIDDQVFVCNLLMNSDRSNLICNELLNFIELNIINCN